MVGGRGGGGWGGREGRGGRRSHDSVEAALLGIFRSFGLPHGNCSESCKKKSFLVKTVALKRAVRQKGPSPVQSFKKSPKQLQRRRLLRPFPSLPPHPPHPPLPASPPPPTLFPNHPPLITASPPPSLPFLARRQVVNTASPPTSPPPPPLPPDHSLRPPPCPRPHRTSSKPRNFSFCTIQNATLKRAVRQKGPSLVQPPLPPHPGEGGRRGGGVGG